MKTTRYSWKVCLEVPVKREETKTETETLERTKEKELQRISVYSLLRVPKLLVQSLSTHETRLVFRITVRVLE